MKQITIPETAVIELFASNNWGFPNCLSKVTERRETFDAFEWNPVVQFRADDGTTYCEFCTDLGQAAEYLQEDGFDCLFFTLYGHLPEGGVKAIHDFPTQTYAHRWFDHLNTHFGLEASA